MELANFLVRAAAMPLPLPVAMAAAEATAAVTLAPNDTLPMPAASGVKQCELLVELAALAWLMLALRCGLSTWLVLLLFCAALDGSSKSLDNKLSMLSFMRLLGGGGSTGCAGGAAPAAAAAASLLLVVAVAVVVVVVVG